MISNVAIIGAGDLGGALAHTLAARDRFAEIRLIDDNANLAAGKALDIQQAAAIDGFRTRLVGTSDLASAAAANIVVFADASGSPRSQEWQDEAGLALVKRVAAAATDGVFVCAGALQRRMVELAVTEGRIARERMIGSAPLALAGAVRALVALEMKGSPADVALTVLGAPPQGLVIPWSDATIAGSGAQRLLTPPQLARIESRVARLWPPGAYALAAAAARICEVIAGQSRRTFPCFVVLDGEFGARGLAASLPVSLGAQGVRGVVIPPLSVQERIAFENALSRAEPTRRG